MTFFTARILSKDGVVIADDIEVWIHFFRVGSVEMWAGSFEVPVTTPLSQSTYLWSAIIESPRRTCISSQTVRIACRAKHHWTTMLPAATIIRTHSLASGGWPTYGENSVLTPSSYAVDVHAAKALVRCLVLPASLPTSSSCPRGGKPLPAQTACLVSRAPRQTRTRRQRDSDHLGLARALVRLATGPRYSPT